MTQYYVTHHEIFLEQEKTRNAVGPFDSRDVAMNYAIASATNEIRNYDDRVWGNFRPGRTKATVQINLDEGIVNVVDVPNDELLAFWYVQEMEKPGDGYPGIRESQGGVASPQ